MQGMQGILEEYRIEVRRVYAALDKALAALESSGALAAYSADCEQVLANAKAGKLVERDEDGNPVMPTSPGKTARAKAAQLIGAASKRALRRYVVEGLDGAKAEGQDVTPAIAQHVCHKIVGRGVQREFLAERYSTPGRTAADKSKLTLAELDDLLAWLEDGLDDLKAAMQAIRRGAKVQLDD